MIIRGVVQESPYDGGVGYLNMLTALTLLSFLFLVVPDFVPNNVICPGVWLMTSTAD